MLSIDKEKCLGTKCSICDWYCPLDIIAMDPENNVAYEKYPDECCYCGACVDDCPTDAIEIELMPKMFIL